FFSRRRRHTRSKRDWSSDVCSSDLIDENSFFSFEFFFPATIHKISYMRKFFCLRYTKLFLIMISQYFSYRIMQINGSKSYITMNFLTIRSHLYKLITLFRVKFDLRKSIICKTFGELDCSVWSEIEKHHRIIVFYWPYWLTIFIDYYRRLYEVIIDLFFVSCFHCRYWMFKLRSNTIIHSVISKLYSFP